MSEIRKVAVLGAGTMGHGIAQVSATAGCEVVLGDVHAEALEAAKAKMKKSLDRFVAKEKLSKYPFAFKIVTGMQPAPRGGGSAPGGSGGNTDEQEAKPDLLLSAASQE